MIDAKAKKARVNWKKAYLQSKATFDAAKFELERLNEYQKSIKSGLIRISLLCNNPTVTADTIKEIEASASVSIMLSDQIEASFRKKIR